MPITMPPDAPRQRVLVRAEGIITHADVVAYLDERHRRGWLGYATLVDCDGADTSLSAADIRELVERRRRLRLVQELGPTVVVAQNDLLYGMMRMYQILMEEGDRFHVVRQRLEAERWLDEVQPLP